MHSLIEIFQVVLDKKRPFKIILILFYQIGITPSPLVKRIALHLNKLKGVAIRTRKLTQPVGAQLRDRAVSPVK